MSKTVRNTILAFLVVFLVSFLLGAIGAPFISRITLSLGLGFFTYYFLQVFRGTKTETAVSDAERASWLTATPPPGKALVYVSRDGFVGKLIGFDVLLNGTVFAQLRSPRFTAIAVTPGQHTLGAVNPTVTALNAARSAEVQFTAAAGEVLAFSLSMAMGAVKGTLQLKRVEPTPVYFQSLRNVKMVSSSLAGEAAAVSVQGLQHSS